jgi:hypothetical protein
LWTFILSTRSDIIVVCRELLSSRLRMTEQ